MIFKRYKMKRNKHRLKYFYQRINLFYPSIFFSIYLIFSSVMLLSGGALYTYHWFILPRGALTMGLFAIFYLLSFSTLGFVTGLVYYEKAYCFKKEKILCVLILGLYATALVLWYNVVFLSISLLFGLIISSIICFLSFLSLVILYRISKLGFLLHLPLFIWSIYLFWFSFCILIIN